MRRHDRKPLVSDDRRHEAVQRPVNPNAARDHLANERTLLAWVRSGIAIMALGFVVARFGLQIRELGLQAPRRTDTWLSTGFGVSIVACGGALVALAALRHGASSRAIDRGDYRPSVGLILVLSTGVIVVAMLLIVYLLITT
jgi:inner membrane protein YidH